MHLSRLFAICHLHTARVGKDKLGLPIKPDSVQLKSRTHLQGGNHLLPHLLGGHQITGHLRVDDPVFLLPADDDGLLAVGRAAHVLLLALSGQGRVGVGCHHRGNWKTTGIAAGSASEVYDANTQLSQCWGQISLQRNLLEKLLGKNHEEHKGNVERHGTGLKGPRENLLWVLRS